MRKCPYTGVMAALAAALAVALVASVTLGRYPIGLRELVGILAQEGVSLLEKLGVHGLGVEQVWTSTQASLLLFHRIPRVVLACLVGCCLAGAGAAYQGVFQNPMASPDLLGASSGAAFGAALAILLGGSGGAVTLSAFCFSLLTVALVMFVGNRARGRRVVGLILAGIMVGSLVSSGTSLIKLVADPNDQLPAITYWLMGSLNGTAPKDVFFALLPMAVGVVGLWLLRWRINLLTLGDEEARTMGVNVKGLRGAVIVCATLITAASVSASGMIGWVGLVIPHLGRKLVGDNYQRLMPTSMLLGAIFLLLVDDVSRNLLAVEIPIGILTSFLGAPFSSTSFPERGSCCEFVREQPVLFLWTAAGAPGRLLSGPAGRGALSAGPQRSGKEYAVSVYAGPAHSHIWRNTN